MDDGKAVNVASKGRVASDPWKPWKPWNTLNSKTPLKKTLKYPENGSDPWKVTKKPANIYPVGTILLSVFRSSIYPSYLLVLLACLMISPKSFLDLLIVFCNELRQVASCYNFKFSQVPSILSTFKLILARAANACYFAHN